LNYPKWFKYVSCIIVYNSEGKILLGKRREGELEGHKWAILGGLGAFGESDNRWDFAKRELEYDIRIECNLEKLKPFTMIVLCVPEGSLLIEDYFYYREDERVEATKNEKAPIEAKWFSAKEIQELATAGQIAFDNYKVLKEFNKQILHNLRIG